MPNGWEWAVLVVIALLLFAGARLSGVGRNVGSAIREFKEETGISATADQTLNEEPPAIAVAPQVPVPDGDAVPSESPDVEEPTETEPKPKSV